MTIKTLFTVYVMLCAVLVLSIVMILGAEQLCLASIYVFGEPVSYMATLFRFVIGLIIMAGVVLGCTQLFGWLYSKYS